MINILLIITAISHSSPFSFAWITPHLSLINKKEVEYPFKTIPDVFIDLIDSIPDYFQQDTAFGAIPDNGTSYCGPTAISNSLIWFSKHGYPKLITDYGDQKKSQYELIYKLASKEFIGTGHNGSRPSEILLGIKRFLDYHNYSESEIKYDGFRPVPQEFQTGNGIPDLINAKSHIVNKDAVWLNLGWYRYDLSKDEYTRSGGHWVTMVGYGFNGKETDTSSLIIHDPETEKIQNDYLIIERIGTGKMKGQFRGLPINADGFYRFCISPHIFGIIDGIAVLKMPKDKSDIVSIITDKNRKF